MMAGGPGWPAQATVPVPTGAMRGWAERSGDGRAYLERGLVVVPTATIIRRPPRGQDIEEGGAR